MTIARTSIPLARARDLLPALLVIGSAACASTGATFQSGVGDAFPEHPPYYAGVSQAAVASAGIRVGHLPVGYQRGASHSPIFDPRSGPGSPVAALLAEMNGYLDSLARASGVSVPLADASRAAMVVGQAGRTPPDVIFGCVTATGAPDDECAAREGALGRGRQPMRLAVGRPSPAWVSALRELTTSAGVERSLVITLEVGQYLSRQTGLRGDKSVELGTTHTVALPWLTSLETPVTVLQLTGALVDRDGKAIRIGAEGIHARRTRLLVSAVGGQELLSDDDVATVRAQRRDDLPGRPLAWQVALRQLVAQLVG